VSNDNVIKPIQPGNFTDQLTEALRNGACGHWVQIGLARSCPASAPVRALTRYRLLLVNIVGRPKAALSKINRLPLSPPIGKGFNNACTGLTCQCPGFRYLLSRARRIGLRCSRQAQSRPPPKFSPIRPAPDDLTFLLLQARQKQY
jgi:hypothetical protein